MTTDYQQLHAGNPVFQRLQQRQKILIDKDHPVTGMVDDVFQVRRGEPDIQGMEHRPHGGHALIEFQVPPVIPHKAGHPVAGPDAMIAQGNRQLVGPPPCLRQGLAMGSITGIGNHLFFGTQGRPPAQNARQKQGCVLHGHRNVLLCWEPAAIYPIP